MDLCTAVTLWKPNAVLSHLSAAWVWGLLEDEPTGVTVTVLPSTRQRAPAWVKIHRRRLPESDQCRGLPVVTLAQVFVDVAATVTGEELERFFDTAIARPAMRRRIASACERSRGMAGMKEVRRQLRLCCLETRSEAERVVARAMSARHFFMEINARVGPYFGDFVDFRARVIVEIDGREFHISGQAFDNDRRRQNRMVREGWLVLRYSAVQALGETRRVVDEIIEVVRSRRRSIDALGRALPRT
ncbi:MAG: endonuclease domain-containing protein [Rhodococcus sp. (in: high G+C Gram-positive bacteria)]